MPDIFNNQIFNVPCYLISITDAKPNIFLVDL